MNLWRWQHRWALVIIGAAVIGALALWTIVVFVAIWTGEGIPAAWSLVYEVWR